MSLWQMIPAEYGYSLKAAGSDNNLALQYYAGKYTTFRLGNTDAFRFNFYETEEP